MPFSNKIRWELRSTRIIILNIYHMHCKAWLNYCDTVTLLRSAGPQFSTKGLIITNFYCPGKRQDFGQQHYQSRLLGCFWVREGTNFLFGSSSFGLDSEVTACLHVCSQMRDTRMAPITQINSEIQDGKRLIKL